MDSADGVQHPAIHDVRLWDALSKRDRCDVAAAAADDLMGVDFLSLETFEHGGVKREVSAGGFLAPVFPLVVVVGAAVQMR